MRFSSTLNLLLAGASLLASSVPNAHAAHKGVRGHRALRRLNFYDDGKAEGIQKAEEFWIDKGYTCGGVWTFDEDCEDKFIEGIYAEETGDDWEKEDFKEGARDGVLQVVNEKEKECLGAPDLQCMPLGEAAAGRIARDWESCDVNFANGGHPPDYEEDCRLLAIDVCEGFMYDAVKKYCPMATASTSDIRDLAAECEKEVDRMIN